MPLPGLTTTIEQNGLGVAQVAANAHVKIGTSSLGTINALYAATDPAQTKLDLGSGAAVSSILWALENVGGPVYFVKVAATNAGAVGTITRTGTSPTPGLTFTGTPLDVYEIIAEMVTGGVVGTATFRVSFDGGDNWSQTFATAATVAAFAADTGLTFAWAAGTYVALDRYTATTTAPTYNSTDLGAALDALRTKIVGYRFIHVVGTTGGVDDATKITNFLALATAVNSKMAEFRGKAKYTRALLEIPDVPAAAVNTTAFANFVGERVGAVYGTAELLIAATKRQERRHWGTVTAAWKSLVDPHESAGNVGRGGIPGVVAINYDEFQSPLLDDLHVITPRTHAQAQGFYITNDWLLAAKGTDFEQWPNGTVIDLAVTAAEAYLVRFVNAPIYVNAKTGFILERDAQRIEKNCRARVAAVLKVGDDTNGSASAVEVQTIRTTNILSTRRLAVRLRIIPVGMSSFVDLNAGLENPALRVVRA